MQKTKHIMPILILVLIVNALSYGTIIPLLYPYASKFGITSVSLGFLYGSYSLFQFLATPIIGRLSDRYGRKPVLLLCLLGTAGSLALFASAQTAWQLFLARILDGITGGNNSVASAIVADVTTGKDRTKAFGMLGATFGIGFLVGPALGGLLSVYGLTAPFWFSAGLALLGTLLGWWLLPETLPPSSTHRVTAKKPQPLFDFGHLLRVLKSPEVGVLCLISLITMMAHQSMILGFQSYITDVLKVSSVINGLLFSAIGLVSIAMQGFGIHAYLRWVGSQAKALRYSLLASAVMIGLLIFIKPLWPFATVLLLYVAVFSPQNSIIMGLISSNTKAEDQGGIMGVQQAYLSLGQIIGPLTAGLISSWWLQGVYLQATLLFILALYIAQTVKDHVPHKADL